MPAFIGVVIAVALYLTACYFAFVWIVAPVWPFMVLGGIVAGALTVTVVVLATLLGAGRFTAPTVTPVDVPLRLPKIRSPFPRDNAWPNYLFAQSVTDLQTAAGHVGTLVATLWRRMVRIVRDEPGSLIFWPLLLLPLTAAITGTVAAVGTALLLAAVLGAVLVITVLGWLICRQVLRGTDLGVRVLRRAKATCTHGTCTHRTRLPAYRCTCGTVHHDIRAGMQGLFTRRCACGALLQTTVLQAAGGLVAVCQDCGRDLRAGAGTLTDVVIPVFGSTSAGKTRLIYAGMVALARHMSAVGGRSGRTGRTARRRSRRRRPWWTREPRPPRRPPAGRRRASPSASVRAAARRCCTCSTPQASRSALVTTRRTCVSLTTRRGWCSSSTRSPCRRSPVRCAVRSRPG